MVCRKRRWTSLCIVSRKPEAAANNKFMMVQLHYLCVSFCSSSSLGHSPDQHSTRQQCYSGERVCDDMHSNSGERTDGGSKSCVDWSRRKLHRCGKHYHGLCTDLWQYDCQFPDTAFPAVTLRRVVLLHCSCQYPWAWSTTTEISTQTSGCDKYITTIYLHSRGERLICMKTVMILLQRFQI